MKPTCVESLGLQGIMGRFVGADDKYIAEVESLAGFHLPDDYRDFLRRYGASLFVEEVEFQPLVPSPWAVGGMESFDCFYGTHEEAAFDLHRANVRLRGAIPDRTIAIGDDPGSNQLLLDASGEVYFFDRDSGRRFLCARSFAEFLGSFRLGMKRGHHESAGENRHGVADERAAQERSSEPS